MASTLRLHNLTIMRNIAATISRSCERQHQSHQTVALQRNAVRNFASYASLRSKQPDPNELPSFSFEGLGMNRNTKVFVIAVLSIFGTIETWVWCKGIYRWWNGAPKEENSA
ncbi:hypothetical protein M440DRAFT_1401453 [Trichoderma longibrachiatum ATCC 18648]|uniref:Uncharacterized protein n=1 Tax=Trichoderma longibrachiatum ATCC 18648 TaxID=983965 RepID=A0A2T4C6B7_TRILO|nr:hypothetical protein M440DRAFT_1401453 [Trichoderma longibrachiatum ATCC 18648]